MYSEKSEILVVYTVAFYAFGHLFDAKQSLSRYLWLFSLYINIQIGKNSC